MRVLVVNPALLRLNALGADEQDRLAHITRLQERGFAVHLLTAYMPYQKRDEVQAFYDARGLSVDLVPLRRSWHPSRLRDLALLDGMAWEYGTPAFLNGVEAAIATFQPERVWCHGSYLWPAAMRARKHGLRAVVRSVNYEPEQLLHENTARGGIGQLIARVRYRAKVAGERRACQADALAAISPDEAARYQALEPRVNVAKLPLQSLPVLVEAGGTGGGSQQIPLQSEPIDDAPLHVYFMGASYNVRHNREALQFLLDGVWPRVRALTPGAFALHILGSKVPAEISQMYAAPDCVFEGYVPDLAEFLAGMHIAAAPSLGGAGMQQKIFEPLCRGFPLIAHARGLAGYPFQHGVHLLAAQSPEADEFAAHLIGLRDEHLRAYLRENALVQTRALFAQTGIDQQVDALLG